MDRPDAPAPQPASEQGLSWPSIPRQNAGTHRQRLEEAPGRAPAHFQRGLAEPRAMVDAELCLTWGRNK